MPVIRPLLRSLRRDRGFAAVAIATLALGIGANTAIFSLIDGVLLRPVPYPEPARLVAIEEVMPQLLSKFGPLPVNGHRFKEWRKRTIMSQDLALIEGRRVTLSRGGEAEQVGAADVSASLLFEAGVLALASF